MTKHLEEHEALDTGLPAGPKYWPANRPSVAHGFKNAMAELLSKLESVSQSVNGFATVCPLCNGASATLEVTSGPSLGSVRAVCLRCRATTLEVLEAVGMDPVAAGNPKTTL